MTTPTDAQIAHVIFNRIANGEHVPERQRAELLEFLLNASAAATEAANRRDGDDSPSATYNIGSGGNETPSGGGSGDVEFPFRTGPNAPNESFGTIIERDLKTAETTEAEENHRMGFVSAAAVDGAAWDRWYASLPNDLRRKLSLHDFKRLGDCFSTAINITDRVLAECLDQGKHIVPATIERCAQVAEMMHEREFRGNAIAAAIRALKDA